jgi:hypothetical protein
MTIAVTQETYDNALKQLEVEACQTTKIEWKDRNWMGRIVYWIHSADSKKPIQKTLIYLAAALIALVLMVSIVGSPILMYAAQQYEREIRKEAFNKNFEHVIDATKEHLKVTHQLAGQELIKAEIIFTPETRKQMIMDLLLLGLKNNSGVPLAKLSDRDLLQTLLLNNKEALATYRLKITG